MHITPPARQRFLLAECYTIEDMQTRHISKAWQRGQSTGQVNLPEQQTRTVRVHRTIIGSERPVRKQHPTKRDINTNPGPDYHDFIGYFNVNQEHQYLVVYPDDQFALSKMLVHSSNGETINTTIITTTPTTPTNAPTTTTNNKTQWYMIHRGLT